MDSIVTDYIPERCELDIVNWLEKHEVETAKTGFGWIVYSPVGGFSAKTLRECFDRAMDATERRDLARSLVP